MFDVLHRRWATMVGPTWTGNTRICIIQGNQSWVVPTHWCQCILFIITTIINPIQWAYLLTSFLQLLPVPSQPFLLSSRNHHQWLLIQVHYLFRGFHRTWFSLPQPSKLSKLSIFFDSLRHVTLPTGFCMIPRASGHIILWFILIKNNYLYIKIKMILEIIELILQRQFVWLWNDRWRRKRRRWRRNEKASGVKREFKLVVNNMQEGGGFWRTLLLLSTVSSLWRAHHLLCFLLLYSIIIIIIYLNFNY